MKNKHIVLMVVILVVLAGLYLAQRARERRARAQQDAAGGFERLLPADFAPDDVRKFVFYAGTNRENAVTVEEIDGLWRLPGRFNALAKTNKVEELLEHVSALEGEVRSESPDVLDEYDLQPDASLHLILTDRRDNAEHHLLIGKKGQAPQTGFVRKDGADTVYLVGQDLRRDYNLWGEDLTDPDAKVWIELQMAQIDTNDVRRLALATPWKRMVVEKREVEIEEPAATDVDEPGEPGTGAQEQDADVAAETSDASPDAADAAEAGAPGEAEAGEELPAEDEAPEIKTEWKWSVVEPAEGYALSEKGVQNWLQALERLNASDVVDPAKTDEYGFDDPQFTLDIGLADGRTATLEVGDEVEEGSGAERYARIRDDESVFTIAGWSLKNAIRKARDVFDIAPVTADRETIQTLTLRYADGKGSLRFARDGEEWTLAEPALGLEPVKSTVDGAVGQMASVRAEDIVTTPGFDGGVDPPQGAATIGLEDGGSRTLVFGDTVPIASPDRFAAWQGEDGLFVVAGSLYTQVMREPGRFLNLELINVDTSRVAQVTLVDGDREILVMPSEDEEGFWRFRMGDELVDAKTAAVGDMLSALVRLRALGIVLDPNANPKFEDRPRRAVLVAASAEEGGEPETYTLIFGGELEDNVSQSYLAMEGRDGLFTVPASLVDRVMRSPDDLREVVPVDEEGESAPEGVEGDTSEPAPSDGEPPAETEASEPEPASEPAAAETDASEGAAPGAGEASGLSPSDGVAPAAEAASNAVEEVVGEAARESTP